MSKKTFNDTFHALKGKLTSVAGNCASSVKIRIELANEESRQAKRFEQLGERVLDAIVDNNFDSLKDDPMTVELIGAIQEKKLLIQDLERRLYENKG